MNKKKAKSFSELVPVYIKVKPEHYKVFVEKADLCANGNMSALIREAVLSYIPEKNKKLKPYPQPKRS